MTAHGDKCLPSHPRSPLVSIGLAVYNGERFLSEALRSLVTQTYKNLEILIGDNASTDRTEAIYREFARSDPRIRCLRSDVNRGAKWNFNRLVGEARGSYFRWAAADDLVEADLIEQCMAVMNRRPDVVLVYPKTRFIDQQGEAIGEYDDRLHLEEELPSERLWLVQTRLGLCNATFGLVRLNVLRQTGLFPIFPGSSMVLLGELALHGKFYELPERLFLRRFHENAASSMTPAESWQHASGENMNSAAPPDQHLQRWRRLIALMKAVERSPIPRSEKARAVQQLLRGARGSRKEMLAELVEELSYRIRRLRIGSLSKQS